MNCTTLQAYWLCYFSNTILDALCYSIEIQCQIPTKPCAELFWFKNVAEFQILKDVALLNLDFQKRLNCSKRYYGLGSIQMDAWYQKWFKVPFGIIWLVFFCSNEECIVLSDRFQNWFLDLESIKQNRYTIQKRFLVTCYKNTFVGRRTKTSLLLFFILESFYWPWF